MKSNKFDGVYSQPCLFCFCCKHFDKWSGSFANCSAFPHGIPLEIWQHKNDHTQPFPGDHGIQYEEAEREWPPEFDDLVLLDEDELYGEK